MDLPLFDFVEEALQLREKNLNRLNYISQKLDDFFNSYYGGEEGFLSTKYRIKSAASFKEKILRNNLYLRHKTPEAVFNTLPDMIGLRIECRFIKDEACIYRTIRDSFNIPDENGFYKHSENGRIYLNLNDLQPQSQRNGFEIYKIDGFYKDILGKTNFELQIMSLVNVFWGEIDHRILYKNYNYLITEGFFRDIMYSIKDNLAMIDRQLTILYDHVTQMESNTEDQNYQQIKSLLAKILHDVFTAKIYNDLGFVLNIESICDAIVDYLFSKNSDDDSHLFGDRFIQLINKINNIDMEPLDLQTHIVLEAEPEFDSYFGEKIGTRLVDAINKDFGWHLLFKILVHLEDSTCKEEIEGFVAHMEYRVIESIYCRLDEFNYSDEEREEVHEYFLRSIVDDLAKNIAIQHVLPYVFGSTTYFKPEIKSRIQTYEDFKENKDSMRYYISNDEGKKYRY